MQLHREYGAFTGLALVIFFAVVVVVGCSPEYKREAHLLGDDISSNVGVKRLRSWAATTIRVNEPKLASTNQVHIARSDLPDWIDSIRSPYPFGGCIVFQDEQGQKFISIVWASGRGVVGVNVGTETYRAIESRGGYWLTLEPGIYVWAAYN